METKRRTPGLAFVLSLIITPGLGQIYNGQLKKGVAFYLMFLMLIIFCFLLGSVLLGSFYGMVGMSIVLVVVTIGCWLFISIEAHDSAKKIGQITLKRYNRWYLYVIIFLAHSLIISSLEATYKNNFPFKAYKIPSAAMAPTLLVGDHLMADMKYHKTNEPQRGDIIIFRWPLDPSKEFIKRIIGLPGEKVEIIDRQIYINGKLYSDRHGFYSSEGTKGVNLRGECKFCSVIVPKKHYFGLGDNRDNSHDSRFWGFVPLESIRGKALYIYWAKEISRIGMEIE